MSPLPPDASHAPPHESHAPRMPLVSPRVPSLPPALRSPPSFPDRGPDQRAPVPRRGARALHCDRRLALDLHALRARWRGAPAGESRRRRHPLPGGALAAPGGCRPLAHRPQRVALRSGQRHLLRLLHALRGRPLPTRCDPGRRAGGRLALPPLGLPRRYLAAPLRRLRPWARRGGRRRGHVLRHHSPGFIWEREAPRAARQVHREPRPQGGRRRRPVRAAAALLVGRPRLEARHRRRPSQRHLRCAVHSGQGRTLPGASAAGGSTRDGLPLPADGPAGQDLRAHEHRQRPRTHHVRRGHPRVF